jgi:hypothetical protein
MDRDTVRQRQRPRSTFGPGHPVLDDLMALAERPPLRGSGVAVVGRCRPSELLTQVGWSGGTPKRPGPAAPEGSEAGQTLLQSKIA